MTPRDRDAVHAAREQLLARLQERYRLPRERAEEELRRLEHEE